MKIVYLDEAGFTYGLFYAIYFDRVGGYSFPLK